MEFSDMQITSAEFLDILTSAWENSEFFDGWDKRWHPEDIAYNFEAVFDGVTQGLVAYCNIVGERVRRSKAAGGIVVNPDNVDPKNVAQKVLDALNEEREQREQEIANAGRVQVFGGTLPKNYAEVYPTYTGNNIFGDNV